MKQGLMVLVNIKNEIVKQLEIFGKVIKDNKFILSYKNDRVRVDDKKNEINTNGYCISKEEGWSIEKDIIEGD